MKTKDYRQRFYRKWSHDSDLIDQEVIVRETDLFILSNKRIEKALIRDLIIKYRGQIEDYIKKDVNFLNSLSPISVERNAEPIIKMMAKYSQMADVGPMAAVAGAIDDFIAKDLLKFCDELILENGGDIFIKATTPRTIGIYAGELKNFRNLAIKIKPEMTPLGVCTSSATVGHSLSFGKADAAIVLAENATLADAAATLLGNSVKRTEDSKRALESVKKINGIIGAVVIIEDCLSSWGKVEFVKM